MSNTMSKQKPKPIGERWGESPLSFAPDPDAHPLTAAELDQVNEARAAMGLKPVAATDQPADPKGGTMDVEYLDRIPAADAIPSGRVVVHNQVRPTRHLGSRGFRAWLAPPSDQLAPCDCGWAPEIDIHYRVVRAGGEA